MSTFTVDTYVNVFPFTRQPDGEEIVIGRPDLATFLALPPDAIEILDCLADGKTIGQMQRFYQEKYGEVPDVEDFLTLLQQKGFIQPQFVNERQNFTPNEPVPTITTTPRPQRFHFQNFPQPLAQHLFSRPALSIYVGLIALGLAAILAEPSIVPGWSVFFVRNHFTVMGISLVLINYATLFLHEMAHLVAARAVGVSSRMGFGHRLWILVAETDMTGIWAVPREQRIIPFLAGALLDAVSAAILTLVFFAQRQSWLTLSSVLNQFGQVLLLTYLLRLLWQCYLFLRTDFYFVIASLLKCKNLMQDTEVFLRNQLARVVPSMQIIDQSHIPTGELRVIHRYALLWIVGRVVMVWTLVAITFPLMYNYALVIGTALTKGYMADPYGFFDALIMGILFFGPQFFGFWLWIRSLCRRER